MTPRRHDIQGPRRSLGAPLSIAASLTLSACLLGSTALVAHADEANAPAAVETTAQAVPVETTAQAVPADTTAQPVISAPAAPQAEPAPAAQPSAPTAAPEPVSPDPVFPAASVAPAATAPEEATMPVAAATPVPAVPATEAPVVPAPALQDAPADAPAAATETPVSTPQQQPTPAASAATSVGVTATVKGVLDLEPGEKPHVGTPVKWTITLHNSTSPAVDVLKALLHLEPGESGDVEDNLAPTTITQADLDAGRVSYASRYDVVSSDGRQIIRAQGALDLPKATSAPSTIPAPTTSPTATPATTAPAPTPTTTASDRVTASVRGVPDLEPGEKPHVGTPVKWTITLHNATTHPIDVLKALLHLEPGESGEVEDNLAPTTLTQADLDAGRVSYTSRYDIVSSDGRQIIRAQGGLDLPETAPTPSTTPTTSPAPTTPVPAPTPTTTAPDRVTASVRGVPDLKPGEKPTVGTTVKWIVTFLHHSPDTVTIDGTTLELTPGRSGYVEDTTQPSTITQADLDAGVVRYESEFGVEAPGGRYTIPARGELTLPTPAPAPAAAEHPSLTGRIAGESVLPAGGRVQVGTPVKWTATLTNSGDVALSDVHVTDAGEHTTLAVGETKDLTFYSTVTRRDIVQGFTFDTFHASGLTPAGSTASLELNDSLDLTSDEGRVAVITTGAFELTAGEQVKAGTRVSWTVTVTNTAGTDLHDLSADGDAHSETIAVLSPGETRQLHVETTVTAQDLAENRTLLIADLVGRTGDGPFSAPASGELAIGTEHPRLEASSTGAFDLEPGQPVTVGSTIIWTVTVRNTGDVSFLDLDQQGPGSIAVGETKVYQVVDAVTQKDLDAGVVRRVSTVTGIRKDRPDYTSAPFLGVLPIPAAVDGAATGTPTQTETSTGTTTEAATTGGTASVTGPTVGAATADEKAPTGFVALAGAAGVRPDAAAGSAPSAPAAASTTPQRGGASAAHLAQTGVDASSALPAAGVLGLLGALGMLLGARRRRGRTAD
jgi:LPXTG-motif cell wall-anchored protein